MALKIQIKCKDAEKRYIKKSKVIIPVISHL